VRFRISIILVAGLLTATVLRAGFAPTDQIFVFHLTGAQVVPPVLTSARGGCAAGFDAGASELTITCVHNVANAVTMAIHRAPPGLNGLVAFDLGSPTSPKTATWSGMAPADVADLLASNLYVRITSTSRPAGELRGQILPRTVDTVNFTLDGARVVPANATSSTGNCTADLDNNATSLAIACTHNVPSPLSAHVHEAPPHMNGPIAFTFPSPASPINSNMPMTPLLLAEFAGGFLYLDVHGAPDQIRGQISATPDPPAVADLAITKTTTATTIAGGGTIPYTITVTNSGPQPATSVSVADVLPAGTTLQSATPSQGSCSGTTTVTCALGTLASGASATVSLSIAAPVLPGVVTNTATVSSSTGDPNAANNSATSAPIPVSAPTNVPTLGMTVLVCLAGILAVVALRAC
jgi:uncharacterized repeat protein (TIGR01451 family)